MSLWTLLYCIHETQLYVIIFLLPFCSSLSIRRFYYSLPLCFHSTKRGGALTFLHKIPPQKLKQRKPKKGKRYCRERKTPVVKFSIPAHGEGKEWVVFSFICLSFRDILI